jgi:hypothetical protein
MILGCVGTKNAAAVTQLSSIHLDQEKKNFFERKEG